MRLHLPDEQACGKGPHCTTDFPHNNSAPTLMVMLASLTKRIEDHIAKPTAKAG